MFQPDHRNGSNGSELCPAWRCLHGHPGTRKGPIDLLANLECKPIGFTSLSLNESHYNFEVSNSQFWEQLLGPC